MLLHKLLCSSIAYDYWVVKDFETHIMRDPRILKLTTNITLITIGTICMHTI